MDEVLKLRELICKQMMMGYVGKDPNWKPICDAIVGECNMKVEDYATKMLEPTEKDKFGGLKPATIDHWGGTVLITCECYVSFMFVCRCCGNRIICQALSV